MSAYYVAARAVVQSPDVYDNALYSFPQTDTTGPRRARMLGPFRVDPYEYPPTFLPLPRLLHRLAPDFFDFRRLWFSLNLLVVVVGLIAVARRVDTALGTHTLWLTPLAIAPLVVAGTFQMGNVQLAFIALPLLGMLALERGHRATGGLLLGFATVSKLFPGLLIVYLLLRRDWRGAAWTVGACAALAAVALIDVGWAPFAAFLDHLPKLLSGEAFPALTRNQDAIAINQSVPGIVFKLRFLGGPFWSFGAAKVVGWAYTIVVLWAIWRLAATPDDKGRAPLVWLSILILASMRSPFLPGYGVFPSIWLATLAIGTWWAAPATSPALPGAVGRAGRAGRTGRRLAGGELAPDIRPDADRVRAGRPHRAAGGARCASSTHASRCRLPAGVKGSMDTPSVPVAPSRAWPGFGCLTIALLAGLVALTASAGSAPPTACRPRSKASMPSIASATKKSCALPRLRDRRQALPGLLIIYLAVRRDWRALAWTTAWALGLTLVTIADIGWAPFAAFLDHMPKLLSGEAFPMLRMQGPPDASQSVPGLVLTLPRFGGPVLPFAAILTLFALAIRIGRAAAAVSAPAAASAAGR